jgi:hypothetical protein
MKLEFIIWLKKVYLSILQNVFISACHINVFEVVCSFNGVFMQNKNKKTNFGLFNDNDVAQLNWFGLWTWGLRCIKLNSIMKLSTYIQF